jgi:hypothetical protein
MTNDNAAQANDTGLPKGNQMTSPAYVEAAIGTAYRLESLLKILSLAADGERIAGVTFCDNGGGSVIDMAADMAGEIVEGLELWVRRQRISLRCQEVAQ